MTRLDLPDSAADPRIAPRLRRGNVFGALPVRGNAFNIAAAVILAIFVLFACFGGLLLEPANAQDVKGAFSPPGTGGHLLGTDALGRDLLSRIAAGARTTLLIALVTDLIVGFIGVTVGTVAGLVGGWVEELIMRVVDVIYSLPGLLMSLVVVFVLGPSARSVIIALCIDGWLVFARLAHGVTKGLRSSNFVEFAKISGCSTWWNLRYHVFPNVISSILTVATLELARLALAEATLSFLSLGIQPPLVSLGMLLKDGAENISFAWWLVTFPGVYLIVFILCSNVLASWIRVATDPLQEGQ